MANHPNRSQKNRAAAGSAGGSEESPAPSRKLIAVTVKKKTPIQVNVKLRKKREPG